MEQEIIYKENLEDYSEEDLEVKKRICEERLDEISEYSFWLRLSKKLGFDIYKLSFAIMFICIGIYAVVGGVITIATFLYEEQARDIISIDLIIKIMMVVFFVMMPFIFIISTEKRGNYKSRLKEKKEIIKLQKESNLLEYKRSFIENPIKVVEGVCGLLNQSGGNLIIGVTKTLEIIGLEKDLEKYKDWDKYLLAITGKIISHLGKTVADLIKIEEKEMNGTTICDIEVKFSSEPIWLTENKIHKFFVRFTNSTRELKGKESYDYIRKHWKPKEEVIHKLQRFKEENNTNIELIKKLIVGDVHYVPRDILARKLKEKKPEKYRYSVEDANIIREGGMWIKKDNFSYDFALQVVGIGHMLDDNFVNQVKEYINSGKSLNQQKDFVQSWILSRPTQLPNPDEASSYYNKLDDVKEKCEEMKKLIDKTISNFK